MSHHHPPADARRPDAGPPRREPTLDEVACRALVRGVIASERSDAEDGFFEIFDTVLHRFGRRVFGLEWDSRTPGLGASADTVWTFEVTSLMINDRRWHFDHLEERQRQLRRS